MKKLVSILTVIGFVTVMVLPINSMAGDEIQLAAALGSSDDNSGSKLIGKKAVLPPPAAASETGLGAGTIAVIGVGVAGFLMAIKKPDSTSNH